MKSLTLFALILAAAPMSLTADPVGVELVRIPTFLVPPDSLVQLQSAPSITPRWTFEEYTSEKVAEFFDSLELNELARTQLANREMWNTTEFGVQVFPTHECIRSLAPEKRAKLYAVLAESDYNPLHERPFLFGANVKTWFRDSNLPQALVDDIDRLCYPTSKGCAFSDLSTTLALAVASNTEGELMRAIYGSPSWIVSVRWPDEANWDSWLDYWTAHGRNVDHVPLLEALGRNRVVATVDLLHLLPPNPRKRLNTWPSLSAGIDGVFPNSFSSALRFFQTSVPDTAIDVDKAEVLLDRSYDRVEEPYEFGDILLFRVDGEPKPRHANVYIAEDLVYTKLSRNVMRPWVIMKLDDAKPFYESGGNAELRVEAWRKRVRPAPR